jgi:hypothetical protein
MTNSPMKSSRNNPRMTSAAKAGTFAAQDKPTRLGLMATPQPIQNSICVKSDVRERPILFSAPMVRALLEGRKTQTRRIVRRQDLVEFDEATGQALYVHSPKCPNYCDYACAGNAPGHCPYGKPGDRLWVREAWSVPIEFDDCMPSEIPEGTPIRYLADGVQGPDFGECGRYRHGRFMMRWMSRTTREMTDVRVQRVEEISEEDALAEGIELADIVIHHGKTMPPGTKHYTVRSNPEIGEATAREAFLALFYDINKRAPRGANPWVLALSFKVIKPEIAATTHLSKGKHA